MVEMVFTGFAAVIVSGMAAAGVFGVVKSVMPSSKDRV